MSADLSPYLLDIEHQLWVDSCTAHAGTTALELLLNKQRGIKVELDRHFLYHELRERSGNPGFGAHIREIGPALKEVGCPPIGKLDELLYFIGAIFKWWQRKPSKRQYRRAQAYRVSNYSQVPDIKAALDSGLPVIVGLTLREAFNDCDWTSYATSPPTIKHVMVVVGYRDSEYLIANSWGKAWGDDGLCWMPMALFDADVYDKWGVSL